MSYDSTPQSMPPQEPDRAPFKCPHCRGWATEISVTVNGHMIIMWHNVPSCLKIISTQMVVNLPPQPQVRRAPSGIILPQ